MANNPGTEGRFLDLNALVQYVQTMPKILNDMNNFQQSVNNDLNALAEKLNQLGNSTNWLETNFERVATQVASLRADFNLFQGIRATSPLQKEGWEFGNDGGRRRFGLQKGRFPGEMTVAQDREMTTGPVEAQSDNPRAADAEGESDPEYSRHAEQLLWVWVFFFDSRHLVFSVFFSFFFSPPGLTRVMNYLIFFFLHQANQPRPDDHKFQMHICSYNDRAITQ